MINQAYPDSIAEVRRGGGGGRGARGGRLGSFRGRIPKNKRLECRCSPGNCTKAIFKQGAFDSLFDEEDVREVLAVAGDFSHRHRIAQAVEDRPILGRQRTAISNSRLTYRTPNAARRLMETFDVTDIYARPVIDVNASDVKIDRRARRVQQGAGKGGHTSARRTRAKDGHALRLADDIDDEFSPTTTTAQKIAALSAYQSAAGEIMAYVVLSPFPGETMTAQRPAAIACIKVEQSTAAQNLSPRPCGCARRGGSRPGRTLRAGRALIAIRE